MDFIEVKRVVVGKDSKQKVVSEAIQVKEIKTFRPWYKSKTDTFEGDATMIVLYNKNKSTRDDEAEVIPDNGNLPTMLIAESFTSFIKRMSGRVIIVNHE
jgi:hypothetical protein